MRLLVDLGNTITMVGLEDHGDISTTWRLDTRSLGTEDQLFANLSSLFFSSGEDISSLKGVCLASVVPAVSSVFEYFCRKYTGSALVQVTADERLGVNWDVEYPAEIGADRVANVLGALKHYGNNAVVVDFGTAITIDVVKEGSFVGGAILLGLETSMKALYQRTARLPQIPLSLFPEPVGRNTEENIRLGITNGTLYALNGIIGRIVNAFSSKPVLITTGGTASKLQEHIDLADHHDPLLTLKGILEYVYRIEALETDPSC